MSGAADRWSRQKRLVFEQQFYNFLSCYYINSKDTGGRTCLGEHIYNAQRMLFNGIFDGLEEGIHDFKVLKSRQLGISAGSRALTTFWLGVHDGLPGAMVFDTDENKNAARREIEAVIDNLPTALKFPKINVRNRQGIILANQAVLHFRSAGVSPTRSSGALGASLGLSFAHCSEMCAWANPQGVEAFRHSLSEINPDRLYVWESTARGRNLWHTIWSEAREDINHQRCIFIGWWAKESQRIDRSDPDFMRYGEQQPTDSEMAKIREVKERYGHQITAEQLAWYRRRMDPSAKAEGNMPVEYSGDITRVQEQATTEDDAFLMTGATFFDPQALTEQANRNVSNKYKAYTYQPGITEFSDTRIYAAPNARSVQLKVWEEPVDNAVYILGCDPAYGTSENNDRSACQVLRAYADGLDQVAEFASPVFNSKQFAWVIASLMGWYGIYPDNEVYHIVELNGSGEAVWIELQSLKRYLQQGYIARISEEKGLANIFLNVRNYIYTRSDAMSAGRSYQWQTNQRRKVTVMELLRALVSTGALSIRSQALLDEMESVEREGDTIEATGKGKDDRVIAMALAVKYWEQTVRRVLVSQNRTRANEEAKRRMNMADVLTMFHNAQIQSFFEQKRAQRAGQLAVLRRQSWRHGRR